MAAFLEKQNVAKRAVKNAAPQRRKSSTFKPINKSAGYNGEFMSHFYQKPTASKKRVKTPRKIALKIPRIKVYDKKQNKKPAGFSFSVPALPTLAVVAGTVVIALAALNWEDINITIPEKYIYQPVADAEVERHTMNYAATGLPGIFPVSGMLTGVEIPSGEVAITEDLIPNNSGNGENDLITFEWQQYRVKRGDAISVIAQRHGVSVGAIIASNEIRNARTLQEGATLRIPNIDGIPYQIKNGDSLLKIAASFNVPLEVILDVNDIVSDNIKPGETIFIPGARMNDIDLRLSLGELFMYPVQSRYITSPYGMRKDPISGVLNFHTGIDLRANTGTTVAAALDGVISVIAENWLYGKYIIITHDNGYKTLYAHLNSFSVNRGDRVARGRKIGESGNTGYSTGPHLHFSIYDKNNKLVNPLELLR